MRVNLLIACGVAVCAARLFCVPAEAGERRSYKWFLHEIMDLDRLPYLEEGVVSRQFSSYNRASRYDRKKKVCVGMDANGDAGHRPTIHFGPGAAVELERFRVPPSTPRYAYGDLEWVLDPLERNHVFFLSRNGGADSATKPPENIVAAIPGPGCIYRIWSADPRGKIAFYFDGSTVPMEFDFKELFLKGATDPDAETLARRREWPFIRPMTFRRPGNRDALASDCYLPIPFAKSCIVTLSQPSFYHIGYKTFPEGTEVETFHLPLTPDEDAVLAGVCEAFLQRGKDPKTVRAGTETISRTVELPPGTDVILADLKGPGIVQAFHAKLDATERYAHSKVLLEAFFDDEADPCIWAPIVNFFGTGFGPHEYKSYPLGYIKGEGYCYFPMPFRKSGRFVVRNEGGKPATLTYRIVHAPANDLPPNTMYFKCKYRREAVCKTFDYPLIDCEGKGRFVGVALCIDDAWRSWWGEGDEKIWVDDDVFPSFFGTGSEDFFGDAWGIRTLQETFFACSFIQSTREYARTCCYRWMVPDDVPFYKRFRATIENYPESQWGTPAVRWDEDYVSVAYWYQLPGGTDFFEPVPVAKRRPWGKVPKPPVIEAEDALAAELERGAKLVDDETLGYEFSRGLTIDLGVKKPGDAITFLGPELILEGPYMVWIHTPRNLNGLAAFRLLSGDTEVGTTPATYGKGDASKIGAGVFSTGRPKLTIRFTSAGRAVFDCFQFVPARRLRDIAEAETAREVARRGPEPIRETGIYWSGGRQLKFPAANTGDAIELEAHIPPGKWDVCVGLTRGPDYGDYRAFINGKSACVLKGYAAEVGVKDWTKLGTLKGNNRQTRFRFVCVGKDPKASGRALGLDYVGWKRIVVENAIEGETANLTAVEDGRITDQKLGRRFSGGNHLWFHPEKVGASFTWLLDAPADGRYELCVYFTKSWDYAIVRLSLDGRALGEFDTYDPQVTWGGKTRLGTFNLAKGEHRLKFEVVGRNEKSKGILVGVDCITLKRQ
ncbi:MAG: DUF2961 domain-containing protein [Kiritimatiellaeota bacterium]|nr:DUF2961 domain-containing protein [Kiritimatiellota bacterium]